MENREFYINDDGIRLHAKLDFPAEEKDKYPLVIVIHGFTGHMEENHIIGVQRAANEIGFACLRIELYGHGKSDGEFDNHTIMKWVEEMLTVIDYAEKLPFAGNLYLAGHSQGGLTTMLAAGMKADKLKAILPLAPAVVIRDACREGKLFGVELDPDNVPDVVIMADGRRLGSNYFRVARTLPVEDAIDRYTKPVLIVHADTDEAVPVKYAYEAKARYRDAELVIIENDTHCYDNHLDTVCAAVKEFLLKQENA